jgi:hypothetical protein
VLYFSDGKSTNPIRPVAIATGRIEFVDLLEMGRRKAFAPASKLRGMNPKRFKT